LGNDAKTNALYIRYRVENLKALAAKEQARIEAEKRAEEASREAEQRVGNARRREAEKTEEARREERELLQTLARQIVSREWVEDAANLIMKIGGTFQVVKTNWYSRGKIVVNLSGETHEFLEPYEFTQWVKKNIVPRVLGG